MKKGGDREEREGVGKRGVGAESLVQIGKNSMLFNRELQSPLKHAEALHLQSPTHTDSKTAMNSEQCGNQTRVSRELSSAAHPRFQTRPDHPGLQMALEQLLFS